MSDAERATLKISISLRVNSVNRTIGRSAYRRLPPIHTGDVLFTPAAGTKLLVAR